MESKSPLLGLLALQISFSLKDVDSVTYSRYMQCFEA